MSKTAIKAVDQLKAAVTDAFIKAMDNGDLIKADLPDFIIEKPADKKNGDFATNAAMACARVFRTAPQKIASAVVNNINLDKTYIQRCEIAGPGFINFFLSPSFYSDVLKEIAQSGDDYGRSDFGKGEKVMVEFVSANPTGPMHMGNARGGALGDCLCRCPRACFLLINELQNSGVNSLFLLCVVNIKVQLYLFLGDIAEVDFRQKL